MTKAEIKELVMKPILNKGFPVYFVGGCVRDEIMGSEPKDYDLVTSATPEDLHRIFEKFSSIDSEKFGVTMPIINKTCLEIATFRKESSYSDGRHPDNVSFTTDIEEDASRRDFTINALYQDIDDKILDPTGQGLIDIHNKVLRFVGNAADRLKEDGLRIYRLARFTSTFGFDVADNVDCRISLEKVSNERISKELKGLFSGKNVVKGIEILSNAKMEFWHMDCVLMDNENQNPKWHSEDSVWAHTKMVMNILNSMRADWITMIAAFFHDTGKFSVERKCANPSDNFYIHHGHELESVKIFKQQYSDFFSKNEVDDICWIIENHMRCLKIGETKDKYKLWKLISNENWSRLKMLAIADEKSSLREDGTSSVSFQTSLGLSKIIELELRVRKGEQPIITGKTLIENGCEPNETFGKIIEKTFAKQISYSILSSDVMFLDTFPKDVNGHDYTEDLLRYAINMYKSMNP